MQSALQYVLQQVLTKTTGHAAARSSKPQGKFKLHCVGCACDFTVTQMSFCCVQELQDQAVLVSYAHEHFHFA